MISKPSREWSYQRWTLTTNKEVIIPGMSGSKTGKLKRVKMLSSSPERRMSAKNKHCKRINSMEMYRNTPLGRRNAEESVDPRRRSTWTLKWIPHIPTELRSSRIQNLNLAPAMDTVEGIKPASNMTHNPGTNLTCFPVLNLLYNPSDDPKTYLMHRLEPKSARYRISGKGWRLYKKSRRSTKLNINLRRRKRC